MKKIQMFDLPCILKKPFKTQLPEDAEILAVQVVKNAPRLFIISNELIVTKREALFRIYGNEEPITDEAGIYIGTFCLGEGKVILHLFELVKAAEPPLLIPA